MTPPAHATAAATTTPDPAASAIAASTTVAESESPSLELLAFTDPVCTWCWGSEPVLRALERRFGSRLRIGYVMGGLVKDIREFRDDRNGIGGDPEKSNAAIARHYIDASSRHGMPVDVENFHLFSAGVFSTYPQNIAYKAAQLSNPELADRYLRRIREAHAAEGRKTGLRDVLVELASESGLDLAAFLNALEDGSAEKAFRDDLTLTARYGVRGFPTFLLRFQGRETLIRGYQSLASMLAVINSCTRGSILPRAPERTPEAILDYLSRYGRAAPVELAVNFELSDAALAAILEPLETTGRIRKVTAGNGFFVEIPATAGNCEPGTCLL